MMEGTRLWDISHDDRVGRLLVATQDIHPGEIVLEDSCLIEAPDGFPVCLGCLGAVDGRYSCPSCAWPCCGAPECSQASAHLLECAIYRENSLVPVIRSYSQPHTMYAMVAMVRMMILKREDPARYQVIEELMDHWEERAQDKRVSDMVKYMAAFCRKKLCLDWVRDEDVQHAFGVLKTNGVGHINPNGSKVCFLYPTVSLMSHSCAANLEIVDSPARSVKFVAKRQIGKGEELTWSYTNFLLPRHNIQEKLSQTWLFDCQCLRCKDPAELGLYYSSRKCVCGGYFCQRIEDRTGCDTCGKQVDSLTMAMEEQSMMKELSLADNADLCGVLQKLLDSQIVHPTHHIMVRLYMRLVESVARISPDAAVLAAAVQHGPALLQVLDRLDGEEGKLLKKYRKMYSLVEYKELVRRQEEGGLSQMEFQTKLEELRENLV